MALDLHRATGVLLAIAVSSAALTLTAPAAAADPVTVIVAARLAVSGGPAVELRPVATSPQTPTGGITAPLRVIPESGTSGCQAGDFGPGVAGAIVLTRRGGGCSESVKSLNAYAAGAVAIAVANSEPGPFDGVADAGPPIPTATLSGADGDALAGLPPGSVATFDLRFRIEERNAPVATADAYPAVRGTPLTVAAPGVLGNDTDTEADALTATGLDTTGTTGAVELAADGSFRYTPWTGFTGTDTFTYLASDGSATSAPATVTITVTAPATVPNRADLAVSLTVPSSATAGTPFMVTLTVRNAGPAAASTVGSGLTVPPGLRVTGGGGGAVTSNGRAVGFVARTLAPGAELTYTVQVTADRGTRGGRSIVAATGSSVRDPVLGDNAAVRTVTVR